MIQAHLLRKRAIVLNLVYIFFLAGLFFPLSFALPIQFQSVETQLLLKAAFASFRSSWEYQLLPWSQTAFSPSGDTIRLSSWLEQ